MLGYDALQTGLILLALALGSFVACGFAGAFGNRVPPVLIVRVGLAAEIVGVAGIGARHRADDAVVGARPVPLRLRLRRRPRDRAAHRRRAARRAGRAAAARAPAPSAPPGRSARRSASRCSAPSSSPRPRARSRRARGAGAARPRSRRAAVDAVVDCSGAAIAGLAADPAIGGRRPRARRRFSDGTRYAAFAAAGFLAVGFAATLSLGGATPREERASPPSRSAQVRSAQRSRVVGGEDDLADRPVGALRPPREHGDDVLERMHGARPGSSSPEAASETARPIRSALAVTIRLLTFGRCAGRGSPPGRRVRAARHEGGVAAAVGEQERGVPRRQVAGDVDHRVEAPAEHAEVERAVVVRLGAECRAAGRRRRPSRSPRPCSPRGPAAARRGSRSRRSRRRRGSARRRAPAGRRPCRSRCRPTSRA